MGDPAVEGQWLGPWETPGRSIPASVSVPPGTQTGIFVIHAVLLRTGKVLWFSGHAEAVNYERECVVWDPTVTVPDPDPANPSHVRPDTSAGNVARHVPPIDGVHHIDPFCCFHVQLDDGRILTLGGAGHPVDPMTGNVMHGTGIRDICIFDPMAAPGSTFMGAWTHVGQMAVGRWYPTAVHLGDGRVFVVSGHAEHGSSEAIPLAIEMLSPPSYAPARLTVTEVAPPAPPATFARRFPTYPSLHLCPDGSIYHTGATWRYENPHAPGVPLMRIQTTPTTARSQPFGPAISDREEGTAVLLSPATDGKILVIGGARMDPAAHGAIWHVQPPTPEPSFGLVDDKSREARILDTSRNPPSWSAAIPLHEPRINASAVLLVDGTVLVLGGHNSYKWKPSQIPSLRCEIFDPNTNSFIPADSLHERRTYHSAALLLPDGSVIVAGGVDPLRDEPAMPGTALNQKTMEVYKPPYLFKAGARPTITAIRDGDGTADKITYGRNFIIETPQAASIEKVVLMRPGAMTHHTDTEQRHIPLHKNLMSGHLDVMMFANPAVAPPGYYMVFIIDDQGRPCKRASFVHLASLAAHARPTASRGICIIATVCYGTPMHSQVRFLTELRDVTLPKSDLGRRMALAINTVYYRFSPKVAHYLAEHDHARDGMRQFVIAPLVQYLRGCDALAARLPTARARSLGLAALLVLSAVGGLVIGLGALATVSWLLRII